MIVRDRINAMPNQQPPRGIFPLQIVCVVLIAIVYALAGYAIGLDVAAEVLPK